MNDIKIFCSWGLNFEFKHNKKIELYIDQIPRDQAPDDVFRFVFLLEPPEIMDLSEMAIWGLKNNTFNYLLTHNESLLGLSDKIHLFLYGTTWIKNYEFPKKDFSVSALVGGKRMASGHHLRQKLWFRENKIKIPKRFYLSGNFGGIENYNNNPILGSDKKPLFDSQFHICIENTKRDNWFTEKLVDCLQTKTIPIYWGCPNIGNWFNLNGFIIVNSLEEIIEKCNSLTSELYENKTLFIEENFEKSKKFTKLENRLKNKILEIVN